MSDTLTLCPACHAKPPVDGQRVYRCHECGWSIEDGVPAATTDPTPEARARLTTAAPSNRGASPGADAPGSVRIVLPWECLASSNLRKGLDPRAWNRYKAAREATRDEATVQVPTPHPRFLSALVRVEVGFWHPDHRERDSSNLLKALLDGLEGVVYASDAQVVGGAWRDEGVDRERPRAEVVVTADGWEPGRAA